MSNDFHMELGAEEKERRKKIWEKGECEFCGFYLLPQERLWMEQKNGELLMSCGSRHSGNEKRLPWRKLRHWE